MPTSHHLAAAQYLVLTVFLVAVWYAMLSRVDRSLNQLKFIFSADYEKRWFFIVFAVATLGTLLTALMYCFPRAASLLLSTLLAASAVAMLAFAVWQFDTTLIVGYGNGCVLALWTCYSANSAKKRPR